MDAGCYLLFNLMQAVIYCLIRFLFQKEESEVRFCAMRWATLLFDMQHCPSRFICMVGAADTKLDIRLAYEVCWLTLSEDSCLATVRYLSTIFTYDHSSTFAYLESLLSFLQVPSLCSLMLQL